MTAVRTEFRTEVIDIVPGDLVFGGPSCRVHDCLRTGRSYGLCIGHHHRWNGHGRPDLEQFAASTEPLMRGYAPLASCRVTGCRYGVRSRGLCSKHEWAWRHAGRPDQETWLSTVPPTDPAVENHAECLVAFCDLWVQGTAPFCVSHRARWREGGFPEPAEFIRLYEDQTPGHERLDLRSLTGQLRLEMQYALQRRHDDQRIKTPPTRVRHVVRFVARTGVHSLLDRTEETWRECFPRGKATTGSSSVALLIYARRQVEELQSGRGWEVEYLRDVWRLRQLGIDSPHAHLRFERIPQPWLKDLAKRWVRWRLSTGIGAGQAHKCVIAITRFAEFLATPAVGADSLAQIDRPVLERYLAELHMAVGGRKSHGELIGLVNHFFQSIRQHRWDDTLPTTAAFFAEDYPKRAKRLPRALAEHVMTQLEQLANMDRWQDPVGRLVTLILMRSGLRVSDALRLPLDCIVRDADNAPYLRYFNHKMKREALVPIDDEVESAIAVQQRRMAARWPEGSPVLFPQKTANPEGTKPMIDTSYRRLLNQWLAEVDVRDEHGRRVRPTPHQWRHTFGTRLINRDVPQEVVRVLLDHDSHMMTAHYARLNEKTIRRHWEQARKVDIRGEQVALDPDGHLAEAAWAKQRLGRVTQALPNGFCGLPLQKTCPHANACLSCPMFVTTPEFLPQHRQQREQLLQIVSAAEARGQLRVVEMNQQVVGNLDRIITALEADETPGGTEVADAG